jgi:cytochrome oxidase Cu insertion factor (SCO1/SenC/PrrC family)
MQNLPQRRTLLIALVTLILALALGIGSLFIGPQRQTGSGTALVGGPFTMVNHLGQTVTEKDFAGKYMLLFFGFTFCPDVCPTELQVIAAALDALGPKAARITPIFVSIDPERDTPPVLAEYVASFDSRLVGLTGSAAQVAKMAQTFRVFYNKVDNPKRPADYQMDHSSIVYLMGPDGKFLKHFTYTTNAGDLAKALAENTG